MSEVNNDANNPPAEDSNGKPPEGQPAPKGDASSSNTNIDPAEQARRDQQSKKDQANSALTDKDEQIDFLLSRELERERDSVISNFLSENKEKYPNVTADDLKYARSEDEVEELAKHLENKYKSMQQKALSDVQGTETVLTPEQLKEAEEALAKETKETGRSTFGSWLSKKQQTRRG